MPPAKEPVEKPEPSSTEVKQEKAKGKVRRKVTAADGSSSTLADYTRYLIISFPILSFLLPPTPPKM